MIRSLSLFALLAVLPACTLFSGASRTDALGSYTGTAATPDFTVPMMMTLGDAGGSVSGTAEMRRGDVIIAYTVSGTRAAGVLSLDLASEGDDLKVMLTAEDAGERLVGTATGGDMTAAVLTLRRDAP